MRIYKLLLVFLTSLALAGCGSKTWDWFFDDDEEEIAYEDEVVVDEEFEEEEEFEGDGRRGRDDDEYDYEYEEDDEYEYEDEEYDEYEEETRKPSRRGDGRGMSRYGDEPEYRDDRREDRGRAAAGRTPGRTVIYFDYKKNVVPANGLNLLQLHAQFLKANSRAVVTVEGHTDSVAPADYNKRLGMVRAQAVADVLVNMGVSPSQIVTVSYGEERPAQSGEDESAHAMNRRVELAY